jgi:hypothetical protein
MIAITLGSAPETLDAQILIRRYIEQVMSQPEDDGAGRQGWRNAEREGRHKSRFVTDTGIHQTSRQANQSFSARA